MFSLFLFKNQEKDATSKKGGGYNGENRRKKEETRFFCVSFFCDDYWDQTSM